MCLCIHSPTFSPKLSDGGRQKDSHSAPLFTHSFLSPFNYYSFISLYRLKFSALSFPFHSLFSSSIPLLSYLSRQKNWGANREWKWVRKIKIFLCLRKITTVFLTDLFFCYTKSFVAILLHSNVSPPSVISISSSLFFNLRFTCFIALPKERKGKRNFH